MNRMPFVLALWGGSLLLASALRAQEAEEAPVLPAVEVEAVPVEIRSKSTTTLSEEAMRGQHAANLNDYLFAGIPGVSTARRSDFGFSGPNAGFSIRGLTGPHVAVFVDGIPSQVNSHFHPRSDQYSPDMIHHVELIRGPSAVLHGASAVGGVVQIFTRRPEPGFSGFFEGLAGELDTREFQGDVGYGWETGSLLFSAMNRATDAQEVGEGFDLSNVNLKLRQEVVPGWEAGFRFNYTDEPASDRFGSDPDPETVFFRFTEELSTFVGSLDRESRSSNSTLAVYFNELDTGSFRESLAQGRFMESERVEQELGFFGRHTWLLGGANTFTVGTDIVNDNDENPKGSEEESQTFTSFFGHASRGLGSRVTIDGGLRVTASDEFDSDVSPEIGVTGQVAPTVALRARGGKAFRVPRVSEVLDALEGEELEPEDFVHAELGLNAHDPNHRVVFDAAVWWMEGDNLLQRVGEAPNQQTVNTGDFSHQGLEMSLNVAVTAELALLFGVGILDIEEGTPFVPQRTFDAGADFRYQGFRASFIGRWAGDNTTDALDDYFVADLRLAYRLVTGVEVLLDVVNLTDEEFATRTAGPNPILQIPRTFLGGIRLVHGSR